MAEKQLKATAKLFVDTKDAKSDAQQFFADLKRHMNDLEKDANKLKVFQSLSEYIATVDRNLSTLKANNPNLFNQMFGGLDDTLRKNMEETLSYAKSVINEVGTLNDKIAQTLSLKTQVKSVMKDAKQYKDTERVSGMATTEEEALRLLETYKRLRTELNDPKTDRNSLEYQKKQIEYMKTAAKLAGSYSSYLDDSPFSITNKGNRKDFLAAGKEAVSYINGIDNKVGTALNQALDNIVKNFNTQIANIKLDPSMLNGPKPDSVEDTISAYSKLNNKLEEYRRLASEADSPNTTKERRKELLNMTSDIQDEMMKLGSLAEGAEDDFYNIFDDMLGGDIEFNEALDALANVLQIEIPQAAHTAQSSVENFSNVAVSNIKRAITAIRDAIAELNNADVSGDRLYPERSVQMTSSGRFLSIDDVDGGVSTEKIVAMMLSNLSEGFAASLHSHPIMQALNGDTFIEGFFSGSQGDMKSVLNNMRMGYQATGLIAGDIVHVLDTSKISLEQMEAVLNNLQKAEREFAKLAPDMFQLDDKGDIVGYKQPKTAEDSKQLSQMIHNITAQAFKNAGINFGDVYKKYDTTDDAQSDALAKHLLALSSSTEQAIDPVRRLQTIIEQFSHDDGKMNQALAEFKSGLISAVEAFNRSVTGNIKINQTDVDAVRDLKWSFGEGLGFGDGSGGVGSAADGVEHVGDAAKEAADDVEALAGAFAQAVFSMNQVAGANLGADFNKAYTEVLDNIKNGTFKTVDECVAKFKELFNITNPESIYNSAPEATRKLLDQYYTAVREQRKLANKTYGIKLDNFSNMDPSDFHKNFILEAYSEYKRVIQEIANMQIVETDDDKKRLQELQEEALHLQATLSQVGGGDRGSVDYAEPFGIPIDEVRNFYDAIHGLDKEFKSILQSRAQIISEPSRIWKEISGKVTRDILANGDQWQQFMDTKLPKDQPSRDIRKELADRLSSAANEALRKQQEEEIKRQERRQLKESFRNNFEAYRKNRLMNDDSEDAYDSVVEGINDGTLSTLDQCIAKFEELSNVSLKDLSALNEKVTVIRKIAEAYDDLADAMSDGEDGDKEREKVEAFENQYYGFIATMKDGSKVNFALDDDFSEATANILRDADKIQSIDMIPRSAEDAMKAYERLDLIIANLNKRWKDPNTLDRAVGSFDEKHVEQLRTNLRSYINSIKAGDVDFTFGPPEKLQEAIQYLERLDSLADRIDLTNVFSISTPDAINGEWTDTVENAYQHVLKGIREGTYTTIEECIAKFKELSVATSDAMGNTSNQTSIPSSGNNAPAASSNELDALDSLLQKLVEVRNAVDAKTRAFEEEKVTVGTAVDAEIAALNNLLDILKQVAGQIGVVTTGLSDINNQNIQTTDGGVSVNEDSEQPDPLIADLRRKAAQYTDLQSFVRQNSKDLMAIGINSNKAANAFWRDANYNREDFQPVAMAMDDVADVIRTKVPENILDGWFRNADSKYKSRLENIALTDTDVRNAALNVMWDNYKQYSGKDIGFEEFLHSNIPVYRGKNSEKYVDGDEVLSFTFDKSIAEKFGNHVFETMIRPIDTIGAYQTTAESEVLVRRDQLEAMSSFGKWLENMSSGLDKSFVQAEINKQQHLSAQKDVAKDYALEGTLQTTNSILNEISGKLNQEQDFSGLIDPLKGAVTELQNVANGIIQHQEAQKSDTTKAMARIQDPKQYQYISDLARGSVGNLGSEVEIKSLQALANGVVKVEGAFKNANDEWEGFTVKINESNKAVDLAINKQSAFAKALNKTKDAMDEDDNTYQYSKEEVEARAQKHLEEYAAQGKNATVQFKDSGRYTITILEEIDGLAKQVFQTFDENDDKIERTTVTMSNSQKMKLENLQKKLIDSGLTDGLISDKDDAYNKYQAASDELINMTSAYSAMDDLSDEQISKWKQQIALVQQLGGEVEDLIKQRKSAEAKKVFESDRSKKLSKFDLDYTTLQQKIAVPDSFKQQVADARSAIENATDSDGLKIAINNWDALKNKIEEAAIQQDLYIKKSKQNKNAGTVAKKSIDSFRDRQIKALTGSVNSAIEGLDFEIIDSDLDDEQKEIVELYRKASSAVDEYSNGVKEGAQVEISSANEAIQALERKVALYKQSRDLADVNTKNFGATAARRETTRFDRLNALAQDEKEGYSSSSEFMERFNKYKAAYDELISKQKEFAGLDSLTNDQVQEFDRLKDACAKLGLELDKVIRTSEQMSNNAYRIEPLGKDFVNDNDGRKRALQDFVRQIRNMDDASVTFDKNFTQCTYSVKQADGTFVQMTAKIDAFKNQIVETAGSTKQATSMLGSLWGDFKNKARSIFTYLVSITGIEEIFQQFRQGVQYVTEIDNALTELKKVTDETDASYDAFLQSMSKTAGVVGSTVSELTTMAADWARLNI